MKLSLVHRILTALNNARAHWLAVWFVYQHRRTERKARVTQTR